ncbi:ABC transporter permease [Clostridium rectalis]|uniref:ABC transporter permease n=1 Tax=Clostridium rectalis TaxID=2040295 RepID=UPI000F63CD62|nr:ABC transporter permease [Clostridium rectalis]
MARYILKRFAYMILTLWIIVTATFFLMSTMPGDPISSQVKQLPTEIQQTIKAKYGLDRPISERYVSYVGNLIKGDMGDSFVTPGYSVDKIVEEGLPISARLGLQAVFFGLLIGVFLGIIAAFRRNTWVDYFVIFIAIVGVSVPSFVLAALLQKGLGGKGGLPIAGWYSSDAGFIQSLKYSILPTLALAFSSIATYARYMRTSVLEVISQDYILTAQAKGVSKIAIAWKHIIRNAILPIITILGPQVAYIITGSLVIERIFSIPGLGNAMINSIVTKDYNVIMGLTIFYSFLYIVALLIVDLLYSVIDPRIRLSGGKK